MKLIYSLLGWTSSTFDIYKDVFSRYGGCVSTDPKILEFLICKGLDVKFYHFEHNGIVTGAFFTDVRGKPGVNVWRDYPVTYDELLFPVAPETRFFFPETTNRLSSRHRCTVKNASYTLLSKKTICHVKQDFTKKTQKNRKNEVSKFLRQGGSITPATEYSAEVLADIYICLFNSRFEGAVKCYQKQKLVDYFMHIKDRIGGYILHMNDKACAFDLMIKSSSPGWNYFDVPNGGVDPAYAGLSVGSVLMWLNICWARELCEKESKEMIFSLGQPEKGWEYKNRWCVQEKLGKVLSI